MIRSNSPSAYGRLGFSFRSEGEREGVRGVRVRVGVRLRLRLGLRLRLRGVRLRLRLSPVHLLRS